MVLNVRRKSDGDTVTLRSAAARLKLFGSSGFELGWYLEAVAEAVAVSVAEQGAGADHVHFAAVVEAVGIGVGIDAIGAALVLLAVRQAVPVRILEPVVGIVRIDVLAHFRVVRDAVAVRVVARQNDLHREHPRRAFERGLDDHRSAADRLNEAVSRDAGDGRVADGVARTGAPRGHVSGRAVGIGGRDGDRSVAPTLSSSGAGAEIMIDEGIGVVCPRMMRGTFTDPLGER